MRKCVYLLLAVMALTLLLPGCKSGGSREFIPGKGWRKI